MKKPDRLYKYEALSVRVLDNLKKQIIYFGSPLHFNDPYDCALTPKLLALKDSEIESILQSYLASPDLTPEARKEFERSSKQDLASMFASTGKSVIEDAIKNFIATKGVSCFSETNDNLLMWSHYGAHGKGVCLEFRTDEAPFDKALKVVYKNEMPLINLAPMLTHDNYEQVSELYCTKSADWSYEREWRCLHHVAGTSYGYGPNSLTGVFFGPNVEESMLEIVCLILKGQNEHVKFWRGERSQKTFSVEFKQFNYLSYLDAKKNGLRD